MYKQGPLLTSADAISRIPREGEITEDETELIARVCSNMLSITINDRIVIEFDNHDEIPMDGTVAAITCQRRLLPTLEEIKHAIHNCSDFSRIYTYLNQGTLHSNDEIARKTVIESQDYELNDGVLYHLYTPRIKRIDRALATISQNCVPNQYRGQVALELHTNNMHIGFDRLYNTVRARFYWLGCINF